MDTRVLRNRSLMSMLLVLIALAAWMGLAHAQDETVPLSPEEIVLSDMPFTEKVTALNRLLELNPRDPDIYNNLGVLYAQREEWPLARDSFLAAVQSSPMSPSHHRNLGLVLVELGDYGMAVSEFEAYRRFTPGNPSDVGLLIGDAWHKSGDKAKALAAYEEGLSALTGVYDGITAQLVMRKALLVDEEGQEAVLTAHLESYLDAARKHLAANGGEAVDAGTRASQGVIQRLLVLRTEKARALTESGQHAQAAEVLEDALTIDATRTDLLPLIAEAWLEAGESMKAKVIAQRAVNSNPDNPSGWRAKGRIAEMEGRTRDALAAFERAYDLGPDTDLAARIGQIYMTLGDNAKARKFMGEVVSAPDTPPELLFNYALSLQRDGSHSLAINPLKKVVAREPEMVQAWRALGTSLRSMGDFSEAAEAYARAQNLEPDAKIAFQIGYCAGKAGRITDSIDAYRSAVDLDPTYEKAWFNLCLSEIRAERYTEALDDLLVLETMEGLTYRIHFYKGICYDGLGSDDEAIMAYEAALEVEETSAAWNNLGLVLDRAGDKKEAAECFKIGKELKAEGK